MKQKKWSITILDNPNLAEILENDEFYTTDTEAFLVFEIKDSSFHPTSATITLHNRTDGSVVNEGVDVISGTIAYEMRQEAIRRAGHWQAQLVYEQDKDGVPEKYTSKVVSFKVSGHLLDNKEPPLFLIENWNNFILSAESLIEDWENAEAERESAESRREETLQEIYLELDNIRETLSALDPNDTSGELQQIKDDIAQIETDLANITPGNYDQEIQQINDELTTINNALSTYETPSGAQEKADTAETNAKAYADSILTDVGGGVSSWNDLTDKPSTFTPSEHTHAMMDVNGLQDALDGLETTSGAQEKADAAETSAKNYAEAEYAPKLTELEQKDAELTAQLAQKVQKDGSGQVTWANIAQDAREQIIGDLPPAVVGTNSVGETNLSPNAVRAYHVDFIDKSSNLVDIKNMTPGKRINSNGTINESATNYSYSHIFRIKPNTTYFVSGVVEMALYDASQNFITRKEIGEFGGLDSDPKFYVSDSSAYYARVNVRNAAKVKQVSETTGQNAVPYEPYYLMLNESITLPEMTKENEEWKI